MLSGLVLMAAFITQCRMVTDSLVRPDAEMLGAEGPNSCIRACIRAANEAREDENERHRDALDECRDGRRGGGDDDDDDDLTATSTFKRKGEHNDKDKKDKNDKSDRDKKDRPDAGRDDRRSNACIEAENERHKAALKAIDAQRRECINGCHHQGGGVGGR
jgi:hypothetical protein